MKQVALIHSTAPPILGETEALIYNHVRLLNQAGYSVRVIAGNQDADYYQMAFHHQVEYYAVEEMLPNNPDVQAFTRDPQKDKALLRRLSERIETALAGVEVCVVYNPLCIAVNPALGEVLKHLFTHLSIRVIAWCQQVEGNGATLEWPWLGAQFVASNHSVKENLARLYDLPLHRIQVIPTGIDPGEALKWSPETADLVYNLGLDQKRPLLLYPTPIEPERGIELAIQVCAALGVILPEANLLVADNAPQQRAADRAYLGQLELLAERRAAQARVHWLHKQDETRLTRAKLLADLYQLADLLLYTDPRDPIGSPVLQAALARLPAFCAGPEPPHGGGKWLSPYIHFFDPAEGPGAVARQIAAYLESSPPYQARLEVMRHLTWESILERRLIPLIEGETQPVS
jgi:glycosyltransferase involved in cell wall biosynthesis